MAYQTLKVEISPNYITVILDRLPAKNAINAQLLADLNSLLDEYEHVAHISAIVLKGQAGIFCTGMDFQEVVAGASNSILKPSHNASYMDVIKRFSLYPKIIISALDGQVLAGGVGFVAASDMVFATKTTNFTLSEALWGLLPACVMPFLIRRVGFQKAYRMTFSAKRVDAEEALQIGLVDEIVVDLTAAVNKLLPYISRIDSDTMRTLKQYFRDMWIIHEDMEKLAVNTISNLATSAKVQKNISAYINNNKLPWENICE
jgi:polyketide biosynthesis enoyl-CoA hydratase PksH